MMPIQELQVKIADEIAKHVSKPKNDEDRAVEKSFNRITEFIMGGEFFDLIVGYTESLMKDIRKEVNLAKISEGRG